MHIHRQRKPDEGALGEVVLISPLIGPHNGQFSLCDIIVQPDHLTLSGVDVIDSITNNMDRIAELCRKHRVRRLEVFGSATCDRFDTNKSDADFLVDFLPLKEGEHADAYFGLLEDLRALLGRPVDLVMAGAAQNPYFLEAIQSSRTELYAA